jgi:hypothetical protein
MSDGVKYTAVWTNRDVLQILSTANPNAGHRVLHETTCHSLAEADLRVDQLGFGFLPGEGWRNDHSDGSAKAIVVPL